MSKYHAKTLLLVQFSILILLYSDIMAQVPVLPTPKYARENSTKIKFESVVAEFADAARDKASLVQLRNTLADNLKPKKKGNPLVIDASIVSDSIVAGFNIPTMVTDSVLASPDGGYFLSAKDHHVRIYAKTQMGIFYGVTTLLHLIKKEKAGYDSRR